MATTTLNIQGMTCSGCVNSVTRVLTGIAGVSRAEVDLAGAKAVVEYDAAQTNPAALAEAVDDAGFEAQVA